MTLDPLYQTLRSLTLPVVAITSSAGGRTNGMIANSAQRASLVPSIPRISMYVSKTNLTHDLIWASGVFGIHLLRTDQWELIWHLGLQSGRDADKLRELDVVTSETGCPLLADCLAAFDCRVVNTMDTGAATFFLGNVVGVMRGREGPVMTSDHFRAHMDPEKQRIYEGRLEAAQEELLPLTRQVDPERIWPGPTSAP